MLHLSRFCRHTFPLALALSLWSLPLTSNAQVLEVRPTLVDNSSMVEQALRENTARTSTVLEGNGSLLQITYRSSEPIEVYLVPLAAEKSFVPTDYVRFTMPITQESTVNIDLTVSPGWSPGNHRYYFSLLSRTENADAAFIRVEFLPASAGQTLKALVRHIFTPEPYTPSSYHVLRGYRFLGISFTAALGVLILLAATLCALLVRRGLRLTAVLAVLIGGSLFYQLRFGIDLLRFTKEHLTGYELHGIYDEAGSVHVIAENLRTLTQDGRQPAIVYVCRDGTNFKEKLLRYFTYPLNVSAEAASVKSASYAVVMDKLQWSFDGTEKREGTLRCGALNASAEKLTGFPDGSVLFRLLPPSPKA